MGCRKIPSRVQRTKPVISPIDQRYSSSGVIRSGPFHSRRRDGIFFFWGGGSNSELRSTRTLCPGVLPSCCASDDGVAWKRAASSMKNCPGTQYRCRRAGASRSRRPCASGASWHTSATARGPRRRPKYLPIFVYIPANISSLMARCTPRGPSFFFSSEIGHTRRSYRVFDQHRRPSGEGLAFGHSLCDKKSSASRRNQLTTWHPSGQRLAGVVEITPCKELTAIRLLELGDSGHFRMDRPGVGVRRSTLRR